MWLARNAELGTRAGSYGQAFGSAFIAIGDVNGDGKADVVSVYKGGMLSVFLGMGDGTLHAAEIFKPSETKLERPLAGDFDGDGRLDLISLEGSGLATPRFVRPRSSLRRLMLSRTWGVRFP